MDGLLFGFEILVIGFLIVLLTLFLLALILVGFNKFFTPRGKVEKEIKKVGDQAVAATVSSGDSTSSVKPEVIAATMGALLFAFDTRQAFKNPVISRINAIEGQNNMWAQVGRTRLLHLRQDFALMRRGKNR